MKKITSILLAICLVACDRGPKPKYTIAARILDGSTGSSAIYKNSAIQVEAIKPGAFSDKNVVLGTATTNDTGWFSITYEECELKGSDVEVNIFAGNNWAIGELPVNKDILGRIYQSSRGQIKLYLQPKTELSAGDTLFVAYAIFKSTGGIDHINVDTFTTTVNGFYKTILTPTPTLNIVWGIGTKQFKYTLGNAGSLNGNIYFAKVTGDPVIDEHTIMY
jgi:hypothetical protein